jgi:hypothetical protein
LKNKISKNQTIRACTSFYYNSLSLTNNCYPIYEINQANDAFLDDLERASFLFFKEQANSTNGFIKDRGFSNGYDRPICIAPICSGLTVLAIKKNYDTPIQTEQRILTALNYIWNDMDWYNGFYYHFIDMRTGKRA